MDSQFNRSPFALEKQILERQIAVESWFRSHWLEQPPIITCSVDLRNAGYKMAAIDTNVFPAGYNNLNPTFYPLWLQTAQSLLSHRFKQCQKILIIAENHTRNIPYYQSLAMLSEILKRSGYEVRVGSLVEPSEKILHLPDHQMLTVYPITRQKDHLKALDFIPCLVILNNDLSDQIPEILLGISQPIEPSPWMGWSHRSKANHFKHYQSLCDDFSKVINIDPWHISTFYAEEKSVDFLEKKGIESLMEKTQEILNLTQHKYDEFQINDKPFAVIKADAGTYGMAVMMVTDPLELKNLNRKQRTHMSVRKGAQKVNHVLIQEGIPTIETMGSDKASAEPVIYLLGEQVIGGFYRVHHERGRDQNLNSPGMGFEMLSFEKCCNNPLSREDPHIMENEFYVYSVIARLAALAASKEALIKNETKKQ